MKCHAHNSEDCTQCGMVRPRQEPRSVPNFGEKRERHEYTNLVNNIAKLMAQQCTLYAKLVPDCIEDVKEKKGRKLRADVLVALQEFV